MNSVSIKPIDANQESSQRNIDRLLKIIQNEEDIDFELNSPGPISKNGENTPGQIGSNIYSLNTDVFNKQESNRFHIIPNMSLVKQKIKVFTSTQLPITNKIINQESSPNNSSERQQLEKSGVILETEEARNIDQSQDGIITRDHNEIFKFTRRKERLNDIENSKPQTPNINIRNLAMAVRENVLNKMVNVSEYIVTFHVKRFIKIFLYHYLFFYIGPFIVPFVVLFDNLQLAQNMAFWLPNKLMPSFILQYTMWIINVMFIILWGNNGINYLGLGITLDYIYPEQYYFYNIQLMIRAFIVAVRYGYCSELRFNLLRSTRQELSYITSDLLLMNWVTFHPTILDSEIEAVMWRNQIEENYFKIGFLEELHPQFIAKLTDIQYYQVNKFDIKVARKEIQQYKAQLNQRRKSLTRFDVTNDDYEMFSVHSFKITKEKVQNKERFETKLLLKEIGLFSTLHQYRISTFILVILAMRMLIPYLVRKYQYGSFSDFKWDGWLYSGLEIASLGFIQFNNYFFVLAGFLDFQRRMIMLKACSALLHPFKNDIKQQYQILPTINLLDKKSLHSWLQLRLCLMDLGRKYMNRIFIYSSTFLGCYLFYAVILLLQFFGFVNMNLTVIANMIALYDIIIILGIMLVMLYFGAVINYQFIENRLQFAKIKETFIFIKHNMESIIDPQSRFTCPYVKTFSKYFVQMAQEKSCQDLKDMIDDIIVEIDSIMDRLELDGEHKPLRLLGLKATYSLMNQIYTSLLTIGFAIAQKIIL